MTGPLLYKGAPKWQVFLAFGAALAIHGIAVGIAALKPVEPPAEVQMDLEQIAEVTFEPASPEPTPPPEEMEEPEPIDAPPEPIDPPEFTEEKPTPPPKPRTDKPKPPSAPIARPQAVGPAAPSGPAPSGKAAMVFKPNIQYPYEAKRARATGSGVVVVSVNASGGVTSATMGKSTGHAVLDNAATSAFRSARFKPGTVPQVRIPITFTLTGAQF